MINQFATKDSSTLQNHLLLEDITGLPNNIYGAPDCLEFRDTKHNNAVFMCLPAKIIADELKEVYMKLMKCRAGNSLKNIKPEAIKRVFEAACLGNFANLRLNSQDQRLMTYLSPFLPSASVPNSNLRRNGLNLAYSTLVPGSPFYDREEYGRTNKGALSMRHASAYGQGGMGLTPAEGGLNLQMSLPHEGDGMSGMQ